MKLGDIVYISVKPEGTSPAYSKTCTVYKIFPHFVVLDTGNYKTCITMDDLVKHKPVSI